MNAFSQLDSVARFYRPQTDGEPNLFEIWEGGGTRGDSVTPSTYSSEYRSWMHATLAAELRRNRAERLLSLGCGNAAVEHTLVQSGFQVLGVDAMDEAVQIARAKGVEAVRGDIRVWAPASAWSLIYMDGVLGHLYDTDTGLREILERVHSWLAATNGGPSATFVASNDAPHNGEATQSAPGIQGFHWLSADYMRSQALAAGFDQVTTEHFEYERPKSGRRTRSIIVARVAS